MSGGSERVNGQASDPVLQSVFLVVLAHSQRQDGAFVEIVEGRVILEFPAVNEEEDGQGVV